MKGLSVCVQITTVLDVLGIHQQIYIPYPHPQQTHKSKSMQQEEGDEKIQNSQLSLCVCISKIQSHILALLSKQQDPTKRLLIAVCGIPGSGKTTISQLLGAGLPNCVVLPMDGFHLQRKLLDQEGIIRRGAYWTFDLHGFQAKVRQIWGSRVGQTLRFPGFSHQDKDPVPDAIQIPRMTQIIIIQGLYTVSKRLSINSRTGTPWNLKIWIECPIESSIIRVTKRHLQCGIQSTYEDAYHRANTNDRANAQYVIENCYSKADFLAVPDLQQGASQGVYVQNL